MGVVVQCGVNLRLDFQNIDINQCVSLMRFIEQNIDSKIKEKIKLYEKEDSNSVFDEDDTGYKLSEAEEAEIDERARKAIQAMDVYDMYHKYCKSYPKIYSTQRRDNLVDECLLDQCGDLARFEKVFKNMEASDILKGKNPSSFKATFDWAMDYNHFTAILSGKYNNRENEESEIPYEKIKQEMPNVSSKNFFLALLSDVEKNPGHYEWKCCSASDFAMAYEELKPITKKVISDVGRVLTCAAKCSVLFEGDKINYKGKTKQAASYYNVPIRKVKVMPINMPHWNQNRADFLKAKRKEVGLTIKELSDLIKYPTQAIQAWESGSSQPSIEAIDAYSAKFGTEFKRDLFSA